MATIDTTTFESVQVSVHSIEPEPVGGITRQERHELEIFTGSGSIPVRITEEQYHEIMELLED